MKILYFSSVREALGTGEEELTPPADVTTVAQLRYWLKGRGEVYTKTLTDTLHVAVDQTYAHPETSVVAAQEVAFFPPVTGG